MNSQIERTAPGYEHEVRSPKGVVDGFLRVGIVVRVLKKQQEFQMKAGAKAKLKEKADNVTAILGVLNLQVILDLWRGERTRHTSTRLEALSSTTLPLEDRVRLMLENVPLPFRASLEPDEPVRILRKRGEQA